MKKDSTPPRIPPPPDAWEQMWREYASEVTR